MKCIFQAECKIWANSSNTADTLNVSECVFDPHMVLLASKAPLLVFCLLPSGAVTHCGPSSHSRQTILTAQFPGSDRRNLLYWLTANLSIIHIPNYRLWSAGWRQQSKDGRKRGKDELSTTFPTGSEGLLSPLSSAWCLQAAPVRFWLLDSRFWKESKLLVTAGVVLFTESLFFFLFTHCHYRCTL